MADKLTAERLFTALGNVMGSQQGKIADAMKSAADRGNFEAARQHLSQVEVLAELIKRLKGLQTDWEHWAEEAGVLEDVPIDRVDDGVPPATAPPVKTKRPLKTKLEAYFVPILETLISGGGSMRGRAVLDRVYAEMESELLPYDLEPLKSNPAEPRWRNTAAWARNSLKELGYLRSDSPHGVWEISDQGRAWLEEQTGEAASQ